jgi:hypothetical protein
VLFFALNLSFDTSTGAPPLVEDLLMLFVPAFLGKFSVLILEPCRLLFLLDNAICWIVVEVRRTTFEAVHGLELDTINLTVVISHICGVKGLKGKFFYCLLCLLKTSHIVV